MGWVKLDDQVALNQKMLKAGPAACWLWVCGIAHCQSQLTDGFISFEALPMIGVKGSQRVKRLADILVQVGLFRADPEGYWVHDYLKHNASKADVLAKRAEDAERKRASESARIPRGVGMDSRAPRAGVPSHPIPSLPLPTEASAAFERFWASYPKRTGRQACVRLWEQLSPNEALIRKILAGVEAYERHVADWKPEFIKSPIRWLEGAHWDDELPTSASKARAACAHYPPCADRWACQRLTQAEASGDAELVANVRGLNAKAAAAKGTA